MVSNAAQAAQAYTAIARQLKSGDKAEQAAEADGFGSLVKNAIDSTTEAGKAVDAKTTALASGKADIVDLVTAVAETEVAVETMVTVRDRVISAYQEILNMPI